MSRENKDRLNASARNRIHSVYNRTRGRRNVSSQEGNPDLCNESDERMTEDEGGGAHMTEDVRQIEEEDHVEEVEVHSTRPTSSRQPRRSVKRGRASSEIVPHLTHAVSGGPEIPDLLYDFEGHIAYAIANGGGRDNLKIHSRTTQLGGWSLVAGEEWTLLAGQSRLTHLAKFMYAQSNVTLINAFIERWEPELNTFHMPWGDMTITLHDVYFLLGIRIDKVVVAAVRDPKAVLADLAIELQISEKEFVDEEIARRGFRYQWLIEKCNNAELRATKLEAVATCYLLYLLGSTLFVDKSQHRLPIEFLSVVYDHNSTGACSWGSAVLAYLYRRLGQATRADCKQMCGCLTLLESWIYAHFLCFRPASSHVWDNDTEPWAAKWKSSIPPTPMPNYRRLMDSMDVNIVELMPYGPLDFSDVLAPSLFHSLLSCMDIHEPYMPDRVGRQFGRQQRIPTTPIMPLVAIRPAQTRAYKVEYETSRWAWATRRIHSITLHDIGNPARFSSDCTDDYLEWYELRTRKIIDPMTPAQRALSHITPWLITASMAAQVPPDLHQSLKSAAFELGYDFLTRSEVGMGSTSQRPEADDNMNDMTP